jgi:mRNA interferase RelE/StbE
MAGRRRGYLINPALVSMGGASPPGCTLALFAAVRQRPWKAACSADQCLPSGGSLRPPMATTVRLSPDAECRQQRLASDAGSRITKYLRPLLAECSDRRQHGRGLTANLPGLWRFRVGDFRVLCRLGAQRLGFRWWRRPIVAMPTTARGLTTHQLSEELDH